MTKLQALQALDDRLGPWWYQENRHTYQGALEVLIDDYKIEPHEALDMLIVLYGAAAGEYGD